MNRKTSARLRSVQLSEEFSDVLAKSLDEHNVSQVAFADAIGTNQQRANRIVSRHEPHALRFHEAPLAPREVALDAARWLCAELGGRFVPNADQSFDGASVAGLARVLKALNALESAHVDALADDNVTRDEADEVLHAACAAIQVGIDLHAWAQRVIKQIDRESRRVVEISKAKAVRNG